MQQQVGLSSTIWRDFVQYGIIGVPEGFSRESVQLEMLKMAPSIVFQKKRLSYIKDRSDFSRIMIQIYGNNVVTSIDDNAKRMIEMFIKNKNITRPTNALLAWIRWMILSQWNPMPNMIEEILGQLFGVVPSTKLSDKSVEFLKIMLQYHEDSKCVTPAECSQVGDALYRYNKAHEMRRKMFGEKLRAYKWSEVREPPQVEIVLDDIDPSVVVGQREYYQDIRDQISKMSREIAEIGGTNVDKIGELTFKIAVLNWKEQKRIKQYKNFEKLKQSIKNDGYLDDFRGVSRIKCPALRRAKKDLFVYSLGGTYPVPAISFEEAKEAEKKKRKTNTFVTGTDPNLCNQFHFAPDNENGIPRCPVDYGARSATAFGRNPGGAFF